MSSRLSNDLKDRDKIWLPIMKCPLCGYETTVTNVCRSCPKAPLTETLVRPRHCDSCGVVHSRVENGKTVFLDHKSILMEYSGFVQKLNGEEKRRYKPKDDDEKQKLWIGFGVVFEDSP